MQNHITIRRLLKLADYLEQVVAVKCRGKNRRKFNMGVWNKAAPVGSKQDDCGSAGCAMGWACNIPSLRRAGLRMEYRSAEDDPDFEYGSWVITVRTKDGPKNEAFWAAEVLFGLSGTEAHYLFNPRYYPSPQVTPRQVARRIRQLVNRKARKAQA